MESGVGTGEETRLFRSTTLSREQISFTAVLSEATVRIQPNRVRFLAMRIDFGIRGELVKLSQLRGIVCNRTPSLRGRAPPKIYR